MYETEQQREISAAFSNVLKEGIAVPILDIYNIYGTFMIVTLRFHSWNMIKNFRCNISRTFA